MENNKTLKDEIIAALRELSGSLRVEIDERFRSFKVELKGELMVEIQSLAKTMDEGFRRQGVFMEAMQDDIDTLIDGQEILHARIDRVQGSVSRIEAKVEEIDARLIAVEIV